MIFRVVGSGQSHGHDLQENVRHTTDFGLKISPQTEIRGKSVIILDHKQPNGRLDYAGTSME